MVECYKGGRVDRRYSHTLMIRYPSQVLLTLRREFTGLRGGLPKVVPFPYKPKKGNVGVPPGPL